MYKSATNVGYQNSLGVMPNVLNTDLSLVYQT